MLERVAIIGFGDFVSASYVAASLANFYGEREIELYTWDESKERCDAMCRVLRIFLRMTRNKHFVYSLEKQDAALHGIQGIVLCNHEPLQIAAPQVPIFDVLSNRWWEENEGTTASLEAHNFQILRWINKEEYPSVFLHENRESPLVKWLNEL